MNCIPCHISKTSAFFYVTSLWRMSLRLQVCPHKHIKITHKSQFKVNKNYFSHVKKVHVIYSTFHNIIIFTNVNNIETAIEADHVDKNKHSVRRIHA